MMQQGGQYPRRGRRPAIERRCPRCLEAKPAEAYSRRPSGTLQSWCRECTVAVQREQREKAEAANKAAREAEAEKRIVRYKHTADSCVAGRPCGHRICSMCGTGHGVEVVTGDKCRACADWMTKHPDWVEPPYEPLDWMREFTAEMAAGR